MAELDKIQRLESILSKASEQIKSVQVERPNDYVIDEGNLLVEDIGEMDKKSLRNEEYREEYIQLLARDAVQHLVTKLWELPKRQVAGLPHIILPKPHTKLPREKPAPKIRPLTKWEQFAKEKGIRSKKKPTKIWDEVLQKWLPNYGYLKSKAEKEKDWLIEIPNNADPFEDVFEKKEQDKKERKAKNELQRLKNIARANKIKVPAFYTPELPRAKDAEYKKKLHVVRTSTATCGRFIENLPDEDIPKPHYKNRDNLDVNTLKSDKAAMKQILLKNRSPALTLGKAVMTRVTEMNIQENTRPKEKPLQRKDAGGRMFKKSDIKNRHLLERRKQTKKKERVFMKLLKKSEQTAPLKARNKRHSTKYRKKM